MDKFEGVSQKHRLRSGILVSDLGRKQKTKILIILPTEKLNLHFHICMKHNFLVKSIIKGIYYEKTQVHFYLMHIVYPVPSL